MNDQKINFLLIEDDPEDTLLMMESLNTIMGSSLKFSLECAESLERGLEFLSRGGIDIVLLDLTLPDSQGIETLIKARAQASDIPIVILTGLDNEAMALEALRQGAQDYLVKGNVSERVLMRAISYAMERNHLLAQMESLVKNSADGIVVIDAAGTVRYVNPAAEAIFGRKAREMLQRPFEFPVSADKPMATRLAGHGAAERTVEIRGRKTDWKGRPAIIASVRDVTAIGHAEQLKAEIRERRKSAEMKDQFLHAVSHEMRGPLTVIKSSLYQLGHGVPLTPQQEKAVALAARSVERLVKFVDGLLDAARWEQPPKDVVTRSS